MWCHNCCIFQIIDKFYRLIDTEGTNSVSTTSIIECISNITNNRPKTGFDKASIERLEQLFKKTVGEGNEIKQEDFKKIVTSKNVRGLMFFAVWEICIIFKLIHSLHSALLHRTCLSNLRQRQLRLDFTARVHRLRPPVLRSIFRE